MPGRSWRCITGLGLQKTSGDKYDVEVNAAGRDTVTVVFKSCRRRRLKPFDLIELIALNKETDNQGGHTYDLKAKIELKNDQRWPAAPGASAIRKEFADRAQFRILTRTIDGKAQATNLLVIPINKS